LRGVRFATTPVVMLGSCHIEGKCARLTYDVYPRLNHGIPRSGSRVAWAAFAVAGSRWIDPIPHPSRRKVCFEESLYSNDPRADHLPTRAGASVRLRLQVFDRTADDASPTGEISTVVTLIPADKEHTPGSSPAALRAVGC
jgi:hypothetical protein